MLALPRGGYKLGDGTEVIAGPDGLDLSNAILFDENGKNLGLSRDKDLSTPTLSGSAIGADGKLRGRFFVKIDDRYWVEVAMPIQVK